MLTLPGNARFFLARRAVDFRKAFDGLSAIVSSDLGLDPRSGDHYIFFNRARDRVKVLVWDRNGFWLYYKRLEKGTFGSWWPIDRSEESIEIGRADLAMLLEGIDWRFARRRKHYVASLRPRSGHGRDARGPAA